jgi:hypothetical protein
MVSAMGTIVRTVAGPCSTIEAVQGDSWQDGRQHGEGYLRLKNTYEDDFEHGRFHGRGFYTPSSGTTYEGDWANDEMDGLGRLTLAASGDILEGQFVYSAQNGFGVRWSKEGEQLRCGVYEQGEFQTERPVPRAMLPFGTILTEPGSTRNTRSPALACHLRVETDRATVFSRCMLPSRFHHAQPRKPT